MNAIQTLENSAVVPFRFESFGVKIRIDSNLKDMITEAEAVSRRALLGNVVETAEGGDFDHHFRLEKTDDLFTLIQNEERIASDHLRPRFFKFFDSILRVAVGEYAIDRVFIHAGVVGWKGKAILIPGDSFTGKTTLVAELVRSGAVYYSDEFAILDADGLVYPFARPLGMRKDDRTHTPYELTAEDLHGTFGTEPIQVGMVLLTSYAADEVWCPKMLSAGEGVLQMIPFTLSIRHRPKFTMEVLNNIAGRAIITSGRRGTVEIFAKTLLNFVDNHLN
ncbi:MAG: hypothetical protein ABR530_00710 [Pyrinomonadaceae bacterium]